MDGKKKILVVEDEKSLRSPLEKRLLSDGFDVITASDGEDGYNKAISEKPDLILLDIILPIMDGITVLNKLRQDPWGKSVPIIILSNLSRADMVEESKNKGVNTYLVKTDWKLEEVVEKVKYELGII